MKKLKLKIVSILAVTLAIGILVTGCSSSKGSTEISGKGEAEEVKTIYAATGGSPSPYITVNEDNELSGYDIEVLQHVFDRLPQYKLEFVIADFGAVLTGLSSGNYQIAVNNFGYRAERAETYYYSYPYDKTTYVFIQRKGDEPLTSFQDVADRGYDIEAGAGVNITNAIEKWNEENPDSQISITYTEADLSVVFEHIEDGSTDFRIDDLPIYLAYQEEFGFEGLDKHPISDEETARISTSLNAYFLLPKDDEGAKLRKEVNEVLKELREDGTLLELSQKYFGADQVPDESDFESTLN